MQPKPHLSFGTINETQWAAAVAYLRRKLPSDDRRRIAREMHEVGVAAWVAANHFPLGMNVRNMLRRRGFTEGKLNVLDLDGAWGHLLCEAVGEPALESARKRQ